jgi:putative SOS response-associated peptidase YedK
LREAECQLGFAEKCEHFHEIGGVGPESNRPHIEAFSVTRGRGVLMEPLHDRMPVILPDEDYDRWLDPKNEDVDALQGLLRPYPAEEMTAFPISTLAITRGTRARSASQGCRPERRQCHL